MQTICRHASENDIDISENCIPVEIIALPQNWINLLSLAVEENIHPFVAHKRYTQLYEIILFRNSIELCVELTVDELVAVGCHYFQNFKTTRGNALDHAKQLKDDFILITSEFDPDSNTECRTTIDFYLKTRRQELFFGRSLLTISSIFRKWIPFSLYGLNAHKHENESSKSGLNSQIVNGFQIASILSNHVVSWIFSSINNNSDCETAWDHQSMHFDKPEQCLIREYDSVNRFSNDIAIILILTRQLFKFSWLKNPSHVAFQFPKLIWSLESRCFRPLDTTTQMEVNTIPCAMSMDHSPVLCLFFFSGRFFF